jgi:hypothetical protein
MATELKNIKRKFETAEASLSLLAKQWGYGEDTRRIVVCEDDGSTKRYYWDATRLADQTTSYGTSLIGTPGITGVTPSGGSSGAAATLQAMLTGLAGTGNGNFIQNGTSQQSSSNFNITGTGVIGTSLGIGLTPSTPLHVSTAFSRGVEMFRLQTATGIGAAGDYLSIGSRHWQTTGSGTNAGASVRFTSVDPSDGVRTAKLGLYGSNNESPTLGLEVGPTGAVTIPQAATLSSTLLLTGVGTFTAAPIFNSVTASQFLLVDGSKALTSVAGTGSGSVVRATSPTITTPTFSGTIASGLTASRTVITDGSGNFSVNTESGSGSHVRATSPTISGLTLSGTTATGLTASRTLITDGSGNMAVNTETGSGSHVRATSPTLVTPVLGAATGTSLNLSGLTASQAVFTDGSKNLVSNAITGSGNVVMSASPTLTGTITAAAATLSGNLTLSVLSAGRIPIVSTAGLIAQDNLYWDATNDWVGVGATASTPAAPLHLTRAFTASAEMIRLQTASGVGAAGDYLSIACRHWMTSGAATFAGGSVRFTSINADTGVRDAKVGLYGSNNEVQTLGLEVEADGVVNVPVRLNSNNATAFVIAATVAEAELELHTDSADILIRPDGTTRATFPVGGGLELDGGIEATSIKLGAGDVLSTYLEVETFTVTLVGVTATVTGTAKYTRIGNFVCLYIPPLSGTGGGSVQIGLSGIPAAIRPDINVVFNEYCPISVDGDIYHGLAEVEADGTLTIWGHSTADDTLYGVFASGVSVSIGVFGKGTYFRYNLA